MRGRRRSRAADEAFLTSSDPRGAADRARRRSGALPGARPRHRAAAPADFPSCSGATSIPESRSASHPGRPRYALRRCTTSPTCTGDGACRRPSRRGAGRGVDVARAAPSSVAGAQLDPHPPAERREPVPVGLGGTAARSASRGPEAVEEGVEQLVAVDGAAGLERCTRSRVAASSSGNSSQLQVEPRRPTTHARRRDPASASSPASFRSPTTRSFGHLSSARDARDVARRPRRAPRAAAIVHDVHRARRRAAGAAAPRRAATRPAARSTCDRAGRDRRSGGRRRRRARPVHPLAPRRGGSGSSSRSSSNHCTVEARPHERLDRTSAARGIRHRP